MNSMTGYGESSFQIDGNPFRFRVKSLNSKFLEHQWFLPDELRWIEVEGENLVRSLMERGKIVIYLEYNGNLPQEPVLRKDVVELYHKLALSLGNKKKISFETLAGLPGVFELKSRNWREHSEVYYKYLQRALLKMMVSRKKEGKRLTQWSKKELRRVAQNVRRIEILYNRYGNEKKREIFQVLKEIVPEVKRKQQREYDDLINLFWRDHKEDLLQYFQFDITEEITRLKLHLTHAQDLLQGEKAAGKQIEFYLQELLRETNTIGAKSREAEIRLVTVEMKTSIERLREQIRNLE